jgi:hypothetical protein
MAKPLPKVKVLQRLPMETDSQKLRLMIRKAALHFVADGELNKFAIYLGLDYQIFYSAIKVGYMSAQHARYVEECVGRDLVQKEVLCPQVFGDI